MRFLILILLIVIISFISVSQPEIDAGLLEAAKNCDQDLVKNLVDQGANVNHADSNNASVLMWSVKCDNEEMVRYLLGNGAKIETNGVIFEDTSRTSYFGNLTCIAAANGNTSLLKYLIEDCGIQVDDKEYSIEDSAKTGWTALQWAAYNGKINSLGYLISKGADININHSVYKFTPLHLAILGGHEEAMTILASNGADLNLTEYNGWSALHYACRDGYTDVVDKFLEFNPDVNLQTSAGYTSLMLAAYNGAFEICEMLVKNGADIDIISSEGQSAIDFASTNDHTEVVNFLNDPENYEREQSWSEINSKYLKTYRKKDYAASITLAKQAEKQALREFGKNHLNYSIALNNLAVGLETVGKFDEAIKNYEKSLKIKEGITGKENEEYIQALKNLAGLYKKLKQYENAIRYYIEVCDLRQRLEGSESITYMYDLIALANNYKQIKEYSRADSALICVVTTLEGIEEKNDEHFQLEVNAIRSRGYIYTHKRNYPEAERYFLETLELVKSKYGEYHEQYSTTLEYLANAYYLADKNDLAISAYQKVVEINMFLFGDKGYTYAYDLSNLGNVYVFIGQYEIADSILNLAANVALDALGENHPDYPQFLKDKAISYKNQGNNSGSSLCL